MRHLRAINQKARRVEDAITREQGDVFALQQGPNDAHAKIAPHYPVGCTIVFSPAGKWIRQVEQPGYANPPSAIFTTATRRVSGRRKCRTI